MLTTAQVAEMGATGMGMAWLGPTGAAVGVGVGAGLVVIGTVFGGLADALNARLIRKMLIKEDIDIKLQSQLIALAEKQQAGGLLRLSDAGYASFG